MSILCWSEPLPIDDHLDSIVETIRNNRVVIVEAEPGAGKTTRLPQAIALLLNDYTCMALPRRSALQPIGERIAAEMDTTPGDLVGWTLAREADVMGPDTRVILQVTQSMVNWITRGGRLPEAVLLIDEAHERSISIDLLLGLVKQLLPTSPKTKVVVTSATIDTEKFSAFFDNAPVIKVEGKCFPVEVRPYELSVHEHHSQGATAAAIEELKAFAGPSRCISVADGVATEGTVVILLPGVDDIREAANELSKEARNYPSDLPVEILTLHGQSSAEDRRKVHSPVPEGTLRFVFGTEVLRASVTVPGCVVVIDSLQVKRRVCNDNGVGALTKISVSRAEAMQGKGRAGRTANGAYRPVVLKNEFDELDPYPTPAILREPIASVVLQIASSGWDARSFEFIDAPDPATINAAVARLQRIGLLNDEGKITDIGREIVNLPVDPDRGMALIAARELGVLAEAIITVAVLQHGNIFGINKRDRNLAVGESAVREIMSRMKWQSREPDEDESVVEQWIASETQAPLDTVDMNRLPPWITPKNLGPARKAKATPPALWDVNCTAVHFPHKQGAEWLGGLARIRWAGNTQNDFAAAVRAWRDYMAMSRLLFGSDLRDWCRGYGVDHRRAQLVTDVAKQLCSDLNVDMADLYAHRAFKTIDLTKALLTGLFDNLGVNASGIRASNPRYDSQLGPYTLLYQSAAHGVTPFVLAGGIRRSLKGNQVAELAARVDPTWLDEMLPHLWEIKVIGNEEHAYFNGVLVTARPLAQSAPPPPVAPVPAVPAPAPVAPAPVAPHQSQFDWSDLGTAVPSEEEYEPEPEPAPEPAIVPPPVAPPAQRPPLSPELQAFLARRIAELYTTLEKHMPDTMDKLRLLAMMRQYREAPTTSDQNWAAQAYRVHAFATQTAQALAPTPTPKKGKKGKNAKK